LKEKNPQARFFKLNRNEPEKKTKWQRKHEQACRRTKIEPYEFVKKKAFKQISEDLVKKEKKNSIYN
jgi:hypothetical protein